MIVDAPNKGSAVVTSVGDEDARHCNIFDSRQKK
jgi:hypothetical protein